MLADPTSFEEPLLDTSVSVVIDDEGGLISVYVESPPPSGRALLIRPDTPAKSSVKAP